MNLNKLNKRNNMTNLKIILFTILFYGSCIVAIYFWRAIFMQKPQIEQDFDENGNILYYNIDDFIECSDDELWNEFKQDCINNHFANSWEEIVQFYNDNIEIYSQKLKNYLKQIEQ